MWRVVQVAQREVHVYPFEEEQEHILDPQLCNCWPDVEYVEGGRIVKHKKLEPKRLVTITEAHWIQ